MKKSLFLFLCFVTIIGCNNHSEKKTSDEQRKNEIHQNAIKLISYTDKEITLISISRNIHHDTLKKLLIDYYSIFLIDNGKEKSYEKIVKQLALKYKLPENKVAKAILDYENYALGNDNSTDESDDSE